MSSSKRARASRTAAVAEAAAGAAEAAEGGGGGGGGEVGRLVDCSQADDRRMIRLVRERRLLYARNNMPVASYYSQVKKLWEQVAREMGWTVADVRRKWSHIRNSYSRHLRNEMYGVRTGRGRMVSKWYLADELDFLREHMATDTRPARYSYAPLYLDMKSEEQPALGPDSVDLKPFLGNPWFALAGGAPAAADPPPRDASASPRSFDADENSAYFQFFRGIHNDYQELPARKQRLFRRECLAFLHRLLDDDEPREQSDALNLSHAPDDERDVKPQLPPDDGRDILPH
ncbi:uncharacterized protein LOC113503803 [Trichoplusia ni]|uniref:Uncharacterized protein LOC113503803 n=1 Tax=Trichoplusia ni TaxID=7111 RepID=A0A7E5WLZ4_TRINI|nr:uncharacterized protein LOC113503803 [Trichoplusia ni]